VVPPLSRLDPEPSPRQVRRGQLLRAALVLGAVAQLAVAIVLAVGQGPSPTRRQVTIVAPADAVSGAPTTTTTAPPPVVVEAPPATSAPPPPEPTIVYGAVSGVIGAGAGGKARADLRDEAGNTWHSEADGRGGYRFDRLPPGRYQLILSAESAPGPCPPEGPCVGTAVSMSKRVIEIGPGQDLREDYSAYGPTGPPAPPVATTVPATVPSTTPVAPSTTTSTTTARR
jgi:hypothetical protein